MKQKLPKSSIKKYFFILIAIGINTLSISQTSCPNSDFSDNNFNSWIGYTGDYNNPSINIGIVPGRHTVITTNSVDPFTCGGLNTIPSGSAFSAQLGNSFSGSESEKLIYQINVTPQNALFIYKYAVVLQDPSHNASEQPGFDVQLLNAAGATIDPTCGVYNVYAGQPGQNFQDCSGVKWLPWNTVGLNLTPYIGTQISIEFTTKDCSLGGHFGYAYIASYCSKLQINVKTCTGDPNIVLSAPPGFATYSWTYQGVPIGTPTQSITIPQANYAVGSVFDCNMTSFSNGNTCPATIQAIITAPATIVPNFSFTPSCAINTNATVNNSVQFNDLSTITNGTITNWNWDFGDGTTSTLQNPTHTYQLAGNYNISLNSISETGCSKNFQLPIVVVNNTIPTPTANPNQQFCSFNNPTVANIIANGTSIAWYSTPTLGNPLAANTPLVNGIYYAGNVSNGCISSVRVPVNVTVLQASVPATGTSAQSFCAIDLPKISNLIVNGTNIKWYDATNGGNLLASNTILVNGTTYYATQNNIGCESSIRFAVTVTLIDPVPSGNTHQEFCKIDKPQISDLVLAGNGIKWYQNATGGGSLPLNTQLTEGDYYVSETDLNNCESLSRLKVNVKLNDIVPPTPFTEIQDFCTELNPTIGNIKIVGNKIQWYSGLNDSTVLSNATSIENGYTYYASQTDPVTHCESTLRTAVTTYLYPCDLIIYNTISPNNNTLNDKFIIKNIETFPNNNLEIFNRFGQLVYKSSSYGINDTYFYGYANEGLIFQNDKKLPTGTYYYILNYQRQSLEITEIKKGFLYINNNE